MKRKQHPAGSGKENIMLLYHEILTASNILAQVFELSKLLWESADNLMKMLIAFVFFAFFSTIILNMYKGSMWAQLFLRELLKAIMIFMLVATSHIIDLRLINIRSGFQTITTLYYIGQEGIIVLENAVEIGVPVPQFLKGFLIKLRDKVDNNKDSTNRMLSFVEICYILNIMYSNKG